MVVVGLGNPGAEYAATRHNAGFMAVDALAGRLHRFSGWKSDGGMLRGRGRAGRFEALLVKPQQYMNRSGIAVKAMLAEGWNPGRILVVYDDVYLPLGTLRLKPSGGPGGHNGLESVLEAAGTTSVPRLRIGVGPAPASADLKEYVLEPFTGDEREIVPRVIEAASQAAHDAVALGLTEAMNRWNRFGKDPVEA
ncbi:MAG TPA: aminoacyl-tRNA hydrolase [Candidatus Eisenbacteria bacterium]|nr:aminoacyl-tRNA hydrolase [Candidatus Eisenbacteria bacterium]